MANIERQKLRKYHIIYQTTNQKNGMIYIGAHSTDLINDGYLGSGHRLTLAIEKYGKESFFRTVLYQFNTPEEMFTKEKEIVNLEFLARSDVYNLVEGGFGGFNKGTTGLKHLHHPETGARCAVHPTVIQNMISEGWVIGRNMSSTSDTIWVHKDTEKKMIDPFLLDTYTNNGWTKGLPKSPTQNKIWIFNNDSQEYSLCESGELDKKISEGWIKKKWAPIKKGNCWINDGKEHRRIEKDLLDNYLNNGWTKGMLKQKS
jgi:hypothetical protein